MRSRMPATDDGHDADEGRLRFRTIWISDVHLGTAGCQAGALLDFLRHTESQRLYLVGDIVDGWQLRRRWFWPRAHNDVVQKVLRKARKGTEVVYILGNHDEFGRHFAPVSLGGIEIREEEVHVTADGRRLLVTHGDLFDAVVQRARWLAFVGDRAYMATLHLNRWFNAIRARLGFEYWSLSQYLKHRVKNAVNYITDFEVAVADAARRRGVDGVVCGHIHKAEIRPIDRVLYCNCGDWVESLTALVEHHDGRLAVVSWKDIAMHSERVLADAAMPHEEPDAHPACN
ncbi:MAG: UDP-2,3-diacylglucosamine diphosphatase [Burkholderiales bacterium]|nr:UDP-2,3-diacylglucosamine diphosphatase [Burkholderiales bacterium]